MKNNRIAAMLPLAALAPTLASAQSAGRPNIIHIMTDDHAFQAISAYGHPLSKEAPTPNLDRLAAEGIRFDRAYVENSLSTPSRACLMTGLYSHQNGQTDLDGIMDSTVVFVPQLLREAGYQTCMIGKWHMRCEPKGFDWYMALRNQGDYYNPGFKTPETEGKYVREHGYATELITKHALEFLDQRDPSKPFCLYVHHKAPHRDWMPALQYLDLYEDVDFPMPDNFYDDYAGRGAAASEQRMSIDKDMSMAYDLKVDGWQGPNAMQGGYDSNVSLMTPDQRAVWDSAYAAKNEYILTHELSHEELVKWKYQRYVKDYLRVIKSVDDSVGEILDYLEKNGLLDNTVVVYTSDQGFYMGEHGWFDKRFMYEESFRTPLIIRCPQYTDGGTTSDVLVQNIDFSATYLDLAGVKQPSQMSGKSLVPVLKKDGRKPFFWRKYLYYHFYDHTDEHNVWRHDGIFDKRYKLIHFYDETGERESYDEFYDIKLDPQEMNNLIGDKKYARKVRKMQKALAKMRAKLEVTEY